MIDSKSILLVEDDVDDQNFFREALMGIENAVLFDIANNGQEALDKLAESSYMPSIIFMDINMPVMNGIECLAAIIDNPVTRKIPVVLLTTSLIPADMVHKYGASGFIKKPDYNNVLRMNLERMIRHNFGESLPDVNVKYHRRG